MEATSDGFKIAEKDLEIRGQGEILGTRQSGIQNFKIGNIVRDLDILIAARREAEEYLTKRRMSPETSRVSVRSDKKDSAASADKRFARSSIPKLTNLKSRQDAKLAKIF